MIADVKIDMKTARNRKNKTKQKLKKMTQYDIMSYRTYRFCPFITFLAFKSGLATNNRIGLLIVHLIINIFSFYFRPRIS